MLPTWVAVALIVIGLVLFAAAAANAAAPARATQIPTGGNTLPGAPFFGPDADSFLGVYTGSL